MGMPMAIKTEDSNQQNVKIQNNEIKYLNGMSKETNNVAKFAKETGKVVGNKFTKAVKVVGKDASTVSDIAMSEHIEGYKEVKELNSQVSRTVKTVGKSAYHATKFTGKGYKSYRNKSEERKSKIENTRKEEHRKKSIRYENEKKNTLKFEKDSKIETNKGNVKKNKSQVKAKKSKGTGYTRQRMVTFATKSLNSESGESAGKLTKDLSIHMAKKVTKKVATKVAKKAGKYIGKSLMIILKTIGPGLLVGIVATSGLLLLLYATPLKLFMPSDGESDASNLINIRKELVTYYSELSQTALSKKQSGETLTYDTETGGFSMANMSDVVYVYVLSQYETNDDYTDMTIQSNKDKLHEIFNQMNYFNSSSDTYTVKAGEKLGIVRCSAYCGCTICCGANANLTTASGTRPVQGRTIAVDAYSPYSGLTFGTNVIIDGHIYTVEDTGNLNKYNNNIDIYFENHQDAINFGIKYFEIYLADSGNGGVNEIQVTQTHTTLHMLTAEKYADQYNLSDDDKNWLAFLNESKEDFDSDCGYGVGSQVAEIAYTKIGCAYSQAQRYETNIYDCSSFVSRLYKECGYDVSNNGDDTAAGEALFCANNNCIVSVDELEPGDLIFYGGDDNGRYLGIHHVAIYVGDGLQIEARGVDYGVTIGPLRATSDVVMYARPSLAFQ